MTLQDALRAFDIGNLVGRDVLGVQLLILAAAVGLFALSAAMMVMASRSAGRARKARAAAETCLRSVQDIVVEARQLSAQIDRATARAASLDAARPIRVGARETTPQADVDIMTSRLSDAVSTRNLDEARESATVPSGLISRARRR